MFGLGKKRDVVGIDIGTSAVKVLQLRESGKGYTLAAMGMAPLPPETIVEGAIMDATQVTAAIAQIFAENKIKARDVATAVSGNAVIVRKIKVPKMSEEELADTIQWEAEQHIPFSIEDVNIDFQVIDPGPPEGGDMDVLLVAVKRDIINEYQSIIAAAGLNVVVVDVDVFALENAYEINYEISRDEVVALVNVGAAVTNINVIKGGHSALTRDIPKGGNHYTEAIQKDFGLSFESAETLKMGGSAEGRSFNEAKPIIDSISNEIAVEIHRSFDFFYSQYQDQTISKMMLSGGCARLPGLREVLQQRLTVGVEIINPFRNISIDRKLFDPEYLDHIAPLCAIPVGLALRRPGDRS